MKPLLNGYQGMQDFAQKKERSQSLQEKFAQSQQISAKKQVVEEKPLYTIQDQNTRYT
jgi:hypothetical protein